jgi:type III secretory pathway lipoprotein EscJ
VLDALGKGSLVPSRLAEHVKVVTGTSGDLERSLRAIDGVVSARVHLAVPVRDPLTLGAQAPPATASVLIRHQGPTPPLAAFDVQRLRKGAKPVPKITPASRRSPLLTTPSRQQDTASLRRRSMRRSVIAASTSPPPSLLLLSPWR